MDDPDTGLGVAMENDGEQVKRVTDVVDADRIANALQHFGLL